MEDSLPVDQIAKVVSKAVTSVLSKRKREDPEAGSDNSASGDSPRLAPSLSRPVTKKKRRY